MQNDDWNRTTSVMRFLSGDFSLLQVTATTFYAQGFMGYVFSLVFGIDRLPYLTLAISIANFYVLAKILKKHFDLSNSKSVVVSLVLFFNPLHIYSSIGFMTENYTLFFMLISLYFLLEYENKLRTKDFVLFNLAGILSFFTKQSGIIVSFAYIPYLLVKKRLKEAFIQSLVVMGLFIYYFKFFPRTNEMLNKGFIVENFARQSYMYSLVYGITLVSISFILPLVFRFVVKTFIENKHNIVKILFIILSAITLYLILNKNFSPGEVSWGEYPYFENTFERTGFFPRSVHGTKYHFKMNYDIFKYWDLGSKIIIAVLIPCLILSWKEMRNIYSISSAGYVVLMIFTETFYDRYILLLIPLLILFFLSLKNNRNKLKDFYFVLITIFVLFMGCLSIQMSIDFVNTNNYIWSKSISLIDNGVVPSNIMATMSWERVNGVVKEPEYLFSFNSFKKAPELQEIYNLVEEKDVGFRGSVFVDPNVYLYKRK